ncbi:hypothetical protein AbraIFM66951_011040 [Aspergillus brasiliensis]|uniref:Uncharacterized protein n=1 Tax=Aspergillus brasiliensis TaxID=319629 RepID=A0A9W6DL47_9EURO|nr:hypothetical protein AbraCBS73388_003901 [Aspergillus brasiliensis]GKZ41759.1 hypothetical protein AbraIFM66951_011040 [Aspergillus brasiliensis]
MSMEELRMAARECLRRDDARIPDSVLDNLVPGELEHLWDTISAHKDTDNATASENLLIAREFLRRRNSKELSEPDAAAANHIYAWASRHALPSAVYAESMEEPSEQKMSLMREDKLRSSLSISVIAALDSLFPVHKAADVEDIILALASFTSEADPWTTDDSRTASTAILEKFRTTTPSTPDASFWPVLENILKDRIRPLFTRTRNPAITAAGRKDMHPIPLPRFDTSILDPESKPWRSSDVYAVTVFSWIIAQYQATDIGRLESHFPLLVPPILALIDDETNPHKAEGCTLLTRLLRPIQQAKSDILQRTNLSSVFTDAIKPCLLSLPTITPEPDSIDLLSTAYPTLFLLLKTSYLPKDRQKYTTELTKVLRENLIPSFHHISTMTPSSGTQSTLSSFPHPKLSTLLLNKIHDSLFDLAVHTTKYLQEIIPLIYSTLSNPFGTAYPPLLVAGVAVTRAVILNAHPRIWRWRGEILGAVTACWLSVADEENAEQGKESEKEELTKLKMQLKGVVYLLKMALENTDEKIAEDEGVIEAKEGFAKELEELVGADEALKGLLFGEVDGKDGRYFGA